MDAKISAPTRVEEILAEWDLNQNLTTSTASDSVFSVGSDTISISSTLDNMSLSSPYTVTGAIGTTINTNFPNAIWAGNGATTAPWMTQNPTGARISLNGESADIEVNGWSLVDAVKRIEDRLGLYQPNPELEQEWEELQALGEQYRQLEQHIRDKQATFDRLKAMPAPDID